MKKLYIAYLFLAALVISACQTQLPDPDTDAVFKSITKIYELDEDGTVNYQYKHELKYLTHFAFNRAYGESFIVYNPERQQLKINKSLTTQANGEQVVSPLNAFNEVLPRFAAGAPVFNHLREMVVTHAGLELGCVVNFDYELKSEKGYIPFLNENILLAENSPVHKMKIVVKVPEGKVLNYKLLNSTVEPKIVTKKGFSTYSWIFEQLKQKSFDRNKPHYNETLPRLVFSSVSLADALKTMKVENSIPEDIIAKVDDKLKDATNDFDKLFALQNMVAKDINAFQIPVQHTAYTNRSFAEVWKTNGATDIEKTLFLAALLNHYEIKVKPVFALSKSIFSESIGLLNGGGHAYVCANLGDEKVIISATSAKAKNNLAYQLSNEALVDFDGKIVEIDSEKYSKVKQIAQEGKLTLGYDGTLKGKVNVQLVGALNPYFELLKDEKNAKAIAGKTMLNVKVKKAKLAEWNSELSNIDFDFEKKEATKKQEVYSFLNLPQNKLGISVMHFDLLTESREAPMSIGGPIEELYKYKLQIPSGYVLVSGNVDTTLTNDIGEVQIKFEHTMEGLEIYKELKLNKSIVSVKEYAAFRSLYLLWNSKRYKELTFKETKK